MIIKILAHILIYFQFLNQLININDLYILLTYFKTIQTLHHGFHI